MSRLNHGAGTHVGNVRSHNEDCYRAEPELGLWLVADGMGGHKGGETASTIAADFIVDKIKAGETLQTSIAQAHHAIKQASDEGKGPEGMGTTIVALKIIDHTCEISWVGDCRAYLWDGTRLRQLTKDHSYVQHLVDSGVISAEESDRHPYQDILLQALGAKDITDVNVETIVHELHLHDQFLLCSDGLTKELDEKDIAGALALELNEQEKADYLIAAAVKKTGKDNITAIVVSADAAAPDQDPKTDTVPMPAKGLNRSGLLGKLFAWLKGIFPVCL